MVVGPLYVFTPCNVKVPVPIFVIADFSFEALSLIIPEKTVLKLLLPMFHVVRVTPELVESCPTTDVPEPP